MKDQKKAFHAPLHSQDTELQTFGCRHTNPSICSRHSLPTVCAFARENNICLEPPKSWAKQFKKLKAIQNEEVKEEDEEE